MTIKIINDIPDSSVVKRAICRNCGVTLEYTPNDTRLEVVGDYGGGRDTYRRIDCPKCHSVITVH